MKTEEYLWIYPNGDEKHVGYVYQRGFFVN